MKTLETERLILRTWNIDDLEDFYEYAKSPEVGPNAGWKPHESKEESASILNAFINSGEVWAIELKENQKVIGSVGLHADKKRENVNSKMLGYALSANYWGHGIMTEVVNSIIEFAFNELNIDVLSVYHYPFNMRSKRVIEKCGFRYEGTIRYASKLHDGTVVDDMCYSILKDEYLNNK